jgi:beta-lactamase superfamily II metal-dependent hydrolase
MTTKHPYLHLLAILLISCGGCSSDPAGSPGKGPDTDTPGDTSPIGKVLPQWQEGYLDIHAINTGRGESTLYIFPDGTTMLADAAGSLISPTHEIPPPPAKPNAAAVSGQTVANYAAHFIPGPARKLNYILVTHWDPDHMGSYASTLPQHPSGRFRLTGITQAGAHIPFDRIIDRGYPHYDYPQDVSTTGQMANYINFVNWAKETYHATAHQFEVGAADQITLQENPAKYTNFQVRNIVGNGYVWTGTGAEKRNTFPTSADQIVRANPDENIFSLGFHLRYGQFDYFAGGDLQYNGRTADPWKDIEAPVAAVMGAVDVLKANHHGTSNCNSSTFLNKLKPRAVLIHTWRDVHPNPETIGRIYAASKDCRIFSTNTTDANKQRLGDYIHQMSSLNGHIVVRVQPGGDKYTIFVLDDTNEDYIVQKKFGPYTSN